MSDKPQLIARILLGLIFFVFGIAGLFNLMPPPQNVPADMMTFMGGLMAAKYFFPLLKITEIICGALLLMGAFVPLALVVLPPIILNITMVHIFLDNSGLPIAIVLCILEVYLAFFSKTYSPIVKQIFRCPMMEAKKNK
jgi:uncharacterized membrane protein YphA (DoxX/SURF4 family)